MDFTWGNIEDEKKMDFVKRGTKSKKTADFNEYINTVNSNKCDLVKSLVFEIPQKNKSSFFFTTKTISLLDVVDYIEKEKGKIKECYLFFFTINEKAVKYTCDLAKRADVKIIISDIMNSKRDKERLITKIFDEEKVKIVFCHNHSKIASFKIGNDFYILTGSMNAGTNAKIETLQIFNDENMYNFIAETFDFFSKKFQIKKRY